MSDEELVKRATLLDKPEYEQVLVRTSLGSAAEAGSHEQVRQAGKRRRSAACISGSGGFDASSAS